MYIASFQWALLLITGMSTDPAKGPDPTCHGSLERDHVSAHGPTASRVPPPTHKHIARPVPPQEIFVRAIVIIFGALFWTYLTAALIEVVVNTDPDGTEFRNR